MKSNDYPKRYETSGVEYYIAVVATTVCANMICHYIERSVRGAKFFTYQPGCLYAPDETEELTKALIDLSKDPNVAAVLLVGLGCRMVVIEQVLDRIRRSGKAVDFIPVHQTRGMLEAVNTGVEIAADMALQANNTKGEEARFYALCFGTRSGSSDTAIGLPSGLKAEQACGTPSSSELTGCACFQSKMSTIPSIDEEAIPSRRQFRSMEEYSRIPTGPGKAACAENTTRICGTHIVSEEPQDHLPEAADQPGQIGGSEALDDSMQALDPDFWQRMGVSEEYASKELPLLKQWLTAYRRSDFYERQEADRSVLH